MQQRSWIARPFLSIRADWKRTKLPERVQALASTVALIISGITLFLLWRQAGDTRTLAEQAIKQSEAAKVQATVAADTFRLAFRPNLTVDTPKYSQTMPEDEIGVVIRNSGSGAAISLVSRFSAFIGGRLYKRSNEVLLPELPTGGDSKSIVTVDRSLSNGILLGPDTLKVIVQVAYDGAPGGRVQVCEAFVYDPMARVFNPTAPCR